MNDLGAQHAAIRHEIDGAIAAVMAHGRFISGPEVEQLERNFAKYCGAQYCIGTSSGTSALEVGLRAAGIGAGDEVITSTFTFFATVEAIANVGATPVLVDVEADTALMAVDVVGAAIGERTAAVVAVHLYGQPVDLPGFRKLADRHGLLLVEDAAQAHGATVDGMQVGSVGDLATFSFFPGKNLGALGDAGAITTNDSQIAERTRLLRNHGRTNKYEHEIVGTNARMDTLQAAVLDVKLRHLDAWTQLRRGHAAAYDEALADVAGIEPIMVVSGRESSHHLYTVRAEDRDALKERLADRDIATAVHYPMPLHRQPALAQQFSHLDLPNAQLLAESVLSIPVYPELSRSDRAAVIAAVAAT